MSFSTAKYRASVYLACIRADLLAVHDVEVPYLKNVCLLFTPSNVAIQMFAAPCLHTVQGADDGGTVTKSCGTRASKNKRKERQTYL